MDTDDRDEKIYKAFIALLELTEEEQGEEGALEVVHLYLHHLTAVHDKLAVNLAKSGFSPAADLEKQIGDCYRLTTLAWETAGQRLERLLARPVPRLRILKNPTRW